MSGLTIILATRAHRQRAHAMLDAAEERSVFNLRPPGRTLSQNDKMHAMLTDVSQACPMGRRHTPDDWKAIFMNACGWECQFQEGLDGRPFPVGFRSSRLSKRQMQSLIDYMYAFGAEHGVRWSEPNPYEAREAA